MTPSSAASSRCNLVSFHGCRVLWVTVLLKLGCSSLAPAGRLGGGCSGKFSHFPFKWKFKNLHHYPAAQDGWVISIHIPVVKVQNMTSFYLIVGISLIVVSLFKLALFTLPTTSTDFCSFLYQTAYCFNIFVLHFLPIIVTDSSEQQSCCTLNTTISWNFLFQTTSFTHYFWTQPHSDFHDADWSYAIR